MIDYIKTIARKKPDTILLHVGTNDLTKGTNTIKNILKCVEAIRELWKYPDRFLQYNAQKSFQKKPVNSALSWISIVWAENLFMPTTSILMNLVWIIANFILIRKALICYLKIFRPL